MEDQFQLANNGQAVLKADLDGLGETSGLADDRVFAELFRMTPYDGSTVRKGMLPYGSGTSGTVVAAGASGSVSVNPFRAFVGTRTAVATNAKKNWRDIRSALGIGTTTLAQTVAIGANSTGNPRWDLVYAAVAVDANNAAVTRKRKNPTSKAVTSSSVVTTLATTVTLGVTPGTAGASPAFPATPTDSGGTYYVPLAYIRVPNGFGASSTVDPKDINEVAPVLAISRTTGASTLRPANQQNIVGGTAISGTGQTSQNGFAAWKGTAGQRPAVYMPPSMIGKEEILIALELGHASSANWSHQNNAIVDDKIDWRKRLFKWNAYVGNNSAAASEFPWNSLGGNKALSGSYVLEDGVAAAPALATRTAGFGQSFTIDADGVINVARFQAVDNVDNNANVPSTVQVSTAFVGLYVDAATGALKVAITGVPLCSFLIWLEATAPYPNA